MKSFRGNYALFPSAPSDGVCIPLTNNRHMIVSPEDMSLVSNFLWGARVKKDGKVYAFRNQHYAIYVAFHRVVLGASDGEICDHINGNSLDNRRENLRLCNAANNCMNQRKKRVGSSQYKGVTRSGDKWVAQISANRVKKNLGRYTSEQDAAIAYNMAAQELHGEFAVLNIIVE